MEKGGRGGQPVKDVVFLWLEQFSFVNIQTLHTEYSHTDYVNPLFYAGLLTGARGTDLPPPPFLTFCLQIYFQ